ncbi:cob(I)yrinic acid a,c-diamide adenosyltransferase [Enteroscipio rubneri]
MIMDHGYVHVYTGDGKGKTTAAVGLSVRAAGAGLRVFFGQFMKNGDTGELEALHLLGDRITVEQFGTGSELSAIDPAADARAARAGLDRARAVLFDGRCDVMVLDEANVADSLDYFEPGALLELVRERPENVELVLTGRGAGEEVLAAADLVTEMRAVKHYFNDGVVARRGIEF